MNTLKTTITKDELNELPVEVFQGTVVVVDTVDHFNEVMTILNNEKVVGFDTETKPVFAKGHKNKVALLQLATQDTCYLLRLNILGFPAQIIEFFNNPDILKIGLSIKDDYLMLRARSSAFDPKGFVELQTFVKDFCIEDNSLQKIFAILFDKKISKAQRLSNWETEELSQGQKLYAALDAWACLRIYLELTEQSHLYPRRFNDK